jgi:hypothetical protein
MAHPMLQPETVLDRLLPEELANHSKQKLKFLLALNRLLKLVTLAGMITPFLV